MDGEAGAIVQPLPRGRIIRRLRRRFAISPWGAAAEMAARLGYVACGLGNAIRAFVDDFGSTLRCDPETRTWACWLARIGYFGRGVAMLPAGFFMLLAGWHERALEARSVGSALWALHDQAFGDVVL